MLPSFLPKKSFTLLALMRLFLPWHSCRDYNLWLGIQKRAILHLARTEGSAGSYGMIARSGRSALGTDHSHFPLRIVSSKLPELLRAKMGT